MIQKTSTDQPNKMTEEEIDKTIEGSFPASDPPSWTLGTDHGSSEIELRKDNHLIEDDRPDDRPDDCVE